MDYKQIMELTQWLEKSNFTSYSLMYEGTQITMSKQDLAAAVPQAVPQAAAPVVPQDIVPQKAQPAGHIVVSPIVGTYYDSTNPDSEPFVQVGQAVKKGDVLCILEAMKIMNEITADVDGTIAEILVVNSEMVEARQPLFRIAI